ncbi:hypothetical protein [Thermocrinis jamiesonii]|uniref:hypothetical protein n=1 Tax=Thermocrinis jamiesonii TaxID=1302351 RepID=UPI0004960ADF|nr:hypothetical protein [Thermocrinis jamiesonii]
MPIEDSYRNLALGKLEDFGKLAEEKLKDKLSQLDQEDLEFGLSLSLQDGELFKLWQDCIENNNYMEVSFMEVMEHHDGAYLKATFKNSKGPYTAERYISIRSSGRIEISHAFFLETKETIVRMEKEPDGSFKVFVKAK